MAWRNTAIAPSQLALLDHAVHSAFDFQRVLSTIFTCRDNLQRAVRAQHTRQTNGAAETRA